jgi:tryptophanyl-tRNA synthetase
MKRIVSGMRPTGKLHLGHLLGAIANWVELQKHYECFYFIADWHALSTAFKASDKINANVRELMLDYLSGGLDPEKCTFYLQSHIPEIAELHLILSMITPVSWAERCPSYKDQIQELGQDIATYGFLGYPVLMSADFLAFKADLVPVGQDQLPHIELCREILRRFHFLYNREIFHEPQGLLTQYPAVPGLDGRKMSKSYDNAIYLSDAPEIIEKKVKSFITDPAKIYKNDPGHPEICNVFYFQKVYNVDQTSEIEKSCKAGTLGCVPCKKELTRVLSQALAPLQEKRKALADHPEYLDEILHAGALKARPIALQVLQEAKQAIGMNL